MVLAAMPANGAPHRVDPGLARVSDPCAAIDLFVDGSASDVAQPLEAAVRVVEEPLPVGRTPFGGSGQKVTDLVGVQIHDLQGLETWSSGRRTSGGLS